ncbi:MAG TPA: hypothetical protein VF997_18920 [Polyangia bacterium]
MGWLLASVQYLPFLIASCVLGGFALWGWRRSGATGALLIAIAAGLRVLHELAGVYGMWRIWSRGLSNGAQSAAIFGVAQSVGALVADVVFIVGVALVLRRLPARAR